MRVFGLTGGIGSGKSAAAECFAARGVAVVDADQCSRIVVEPGRPALQAIAEHFGREILLSDGSLNRAALRERIFDDSQQRQWLEALLHPLIGEEISHQLAAATSGYALLMSPLLLETGQKQHCEKVIVVDVPEQEQMSRTVTRDGVPQAQVQSIMRAQMSRRERLAAADFVLDNLGSLADLDAAVAELHAELQALAAEENTSA